MPRPLRTFVKSRFPRFLSTYKKIRHRATIEYKVLRQVGIRSIIRGDLWRKEDWQDLLPIQVPQRIEITGLAFSSTGELADQLDAAGLGHADGGNALYLPPETIAASEFRVVLDYYPPDTGLKLVRDPGGIDESQYVSDEARSAINRKLTSSHGQLAMAASLLHEKGLGPRLYDLVELDISGNLWTAYAIQHVDGRAPNMVECEAGIKRLHELESSRVVRMTLPGGYDHKDFSCPDCNGNALISADGGFNYVDFQNFVLASYDEYLHGLAKSASKETHFGPRGALRGESFLYQSIPGIRMPSRRKIDERFAVIGKMMTDHGAIVQDKIVLDVGCNIGMTMAEYLRRGASWCHGWDMPPIARHARHILPALGCTRFSVTGQMLEKDRRLEDDLDGFIHRRLDGCIISYLSVHLHIGWLDALGRIPWSYLIYEGHQGEDFDANMRDLAALVDVEIQEMKLYADGLSDERPVAILKRNQEQ